MTNLEKYFNTCISIVFTQLYDIKLLETATHINSRGIIVIEYVHQIILYKTLYNKFKSFQILISCMLYRRTDK